MCSWLTLWVPAGRVATGRLSNPHRHEIRMALDHTLTRSLDYGVLACRRLTNQGVRGSSALLSVTQAVWTTRPQGSTSVKVLLSIS